jgi:hypothetical protein
MNRRLAAVIGVVVVVLGGAAAGWFLAGPGLTATAAAAKPSQTATRTPSASAARTRIRRNWTTFFSGSTPPSRKIALLQHGQRFTSAVNGMARSPTAKNASARVTRVRLTGPDTATVTYNMLLNGKPALTHRTGTAVRVNGTWKVSDQAFCQLVALSGSRPQACPAPAPSASARASS